MKRRNRNMIIGEVARYGFGYRTFEYEIHVRTVDPEGLGFRLVFRVFMSDLDLVFRVFG